MKMRFCEAFDAFADLDRVGEHVLNTIYPRDRVARGDSGVPMSHSMFDNTFIRSLGEDVVIFQFNLILSLISFIALIHKYIHKIKWGCFPSSVTLGKATAHMHT
jgi:hypothetical protein